jgi:capsular polysaccharide biosynthesis protein
VLAIVRAKKKNQMNFILTAPSLNDLIRLLKAWRFWMLGAILGAVIGAAVYFIIPPPFRAQATVNVDFNLEQAWPQNTDRQQFYYLERETRKLEEIAWSDDLMDQLSSKFRIPVPSLRGNKLQLSQPAEAGWHFYANDKDSHVAGSLASAWAVAFVTKAQAEVKAGNVNEFVKFEATQSQNLPKKRSIPLSGYLFAGSIGFLTLAVFVMLFIKPKSEPGVS